MIEHYRKVLFLGAHPDDEVGCAGTISRLWEHGAEVWASTFSRCEDLIPEGFEVDDLINEWRKAFTLLGVERKHLRLWDIPNRLLPEQRQELLDALDTLRRDAWQQPFDLILTPSSTDAHQDHAQVTAEAVRVFKQTTMLGYELPLNAVRSSVPNGFVKLRAREMELKLDHAYVYRSQAAKAYMSPDYIHSLARVRGVQAGTEYAEAFEVIRWIA